MANIILLITLISLGLFLIILTSLIYRRLIKTPIKYAYNSQVVKSISILSDDLISEFDINSSDYWVSKNEISKSVDEIYKDFEANKSELLTEGVFYLGIPTPRSLRGLKNLLKKLNQILFFRSR